ncbi:MAG TPA: acyl-CoA dehydrogenase family protein [Terriglobales bacterium]|nr:acyl-CoA dehydrogenase family protein [Terriglobales bacterium]
MVSFSPSEEQQLIKDMVAQFAADKVRPAAHHADESGEIPAELIQEGWQLGLVQSLIPESFGGAGDSRSAVTGALIAEELAYGDLSIALHLLAPRLVIYPLLACGTAEQQQRILPAYAGEQFVAGTAAVMEPRFDFDLAELKTTASAAGDGFRLNGRKCYVPLAAEAEHIVVYAQTGSGYDGVAGFLVPKGASGLSIGEREKNMGLKALATYELSLEDCRVGAAERIGQGDGNGFAAAMSYSRVALAAMAVGVARAAFEYARDYAKDRRAFGVAIGQKQAIAFMLAEMAIEIDAARLLCWEAAWRLDQGLPAVRESYLAKQYADKMVLEVTDNAVQVLGGHGYIREHPVELWLRNGRGFAVLEGLATV